MLHAPTRFRLAHGCALAVLSLTLFGALGCDSQARGKEGDTCTEDSECLTGLSCSAETKTCILDDGLKVAPDIETLPDVEVTEPDTSEPDTAEDVDAVDMPEMLTCDEGVTRACGLDVGACTIGEQTCVDGAWTECSGVAPTDEVCDDIDNDCDGTIDGTNGVFLQQTCGSDVGECTFGSQSCTAGQWGACKGNIEPQDELCDGLDNDCNGAPDEDYALDAPTWWADTDADGYGDPANTTRACGDMPPMGFAANDLDCNPAVAAIYPGAPELCDGVDNDCDDTTIDGLAETWIGMACDGGDADLCAEGTLVCDASGNQICDDTTGDTLEICDGLDNDCNPATPDGVMEAWYQTACDGIDSDLCTEGTWLCDPTSGQVCSDDTTGDLELCDGVDNDCDPTTVDGADEVWLAQACDGVDSDLCAEGAYACQGGTQACTDTTGNDLDVCDGLDNDCNPATADGSAEAWLGDVCDGPDSDACAEGTYLCAAGAQACTDTTADNVELCDGVDNDCDVSTPDGAAEAWLGSACDGPDADLCTEGVYQCAAGGQSCSDVSTDSVDVCDGLDNDCDATTADGSGEAWFALACDGPDGDACLEGTYQCDSATGAQTCSDTSGTALEICDGIDNDCDPSTPDGADEAWLGAACDGLDSDLCTEGAYQCVGGAQSCSDTSSDSLDVCDGTDNDCNPATADGAAEIWFAQACDGADTDLCNEGVYQCAAGAQSCSDGSGDSLDVCDGADNDCNPATPDGAGEAWFALSCDGADSDLCEEGTWLCAAGAQSCSDTSADDLEVCDGIDNDCDAATFDGADEAWLAQACDGPDSDQCTEGVYQCAAGAQACTDTSGDDVELCDGIDNDCNAATADGSAEAWLGVVCDGPDSDLCTEGSYVCQAAAQACTDTSGDSLEVCDGIDNDCNAATADGTAEAWLNAACDGADADLCTEGVYQCAAGAQSCTDTTGDAVEICDGADNDCDGTTDPGCSCINGTTQPCYSGPPGTQGVGICTGGTQTCSGGVWGACVGEQTPQAEVCDGGIDNDCNAATPDGAAEAWYNVACDGPDSDLCTEGVYQCVGSSQTCSDSSGDTVDVCDGLDNDCNPATADGTAEAWLDTACDGPDSDLCTEGQWKCSGGAQFCNDLSGNNAEICDGTDNDCRPSTADGADEAWLNVACDGPDSDVCTEGTFQCAAGAQSCTDTSGDDLEVCDGIDNDCRPGTADGADEAWLAQACDGPDGDLCTEGTYQCAAGAQSCTDTSGDNAEVCDGVDNDCDPATTDGADEAWLAQACDGPDTDLCAEGTWSCAAGAQSCSDTTGNDVEVCDGADNDCNPATADGSGEGWFATACDGPDSDLCTEGAWQCNAGAQSCSDSTSDDLEVCDGADNDCNPATADGADAAWIGTACDGPDSDLCAEGTFSCTAGAQACSDATGDDLEVCDGANNDCNPATADGADEAWYLSACDGPDSDLCTEGINQCSGGSQLCTDSSGDNSEVCDGADNDCNPATPDGSDAVWYGAACDGADADQCEEGVFQCSAGSQSCTDTTGTTSDVCDGVDNDCNPGTADGSGEAWFGTTCDGPDADLCDEGAWQCSGGAQTCSDATGDNTEVCDGIDNDCRPATADGSGTAWYGAVCDGPDTDACTEGTFQCVAGAQSCSDNTSDNLEICDSNDNDCDGSIDEGCPACNVIDNDFDGSNQCDDCDDTNGSIYPGAMEICDGIDNDCDGSIDEDFDGDSDGFSICALDPTLFDCDDSNPNVNPGMAELCGPGGLGNTIDDNCNGYVDEGCGNCDPVDSDGDGVSECDGDCDPGDGSVYPGNAEVCDGADNDCNLYTVDNCGVSETCNQDADGNFDNDPDQCEDDLLCACAVDRFGTCQGDYLCTSFCNTSETGSVGDACAANETCFYRLQRSDNLHGCAVATDAPGTLMGAEDCSADEDCRSNQCDKPCTGPGCNQKICYDYCGSDAYCDAPGTLCRVRRTSAVIEGICWKEDGPFTDITGALGDACTSDSQCANGLCADSQGGICTRGCCQESDCGAGYTCSLEGDKVDSTVGIQDPSGASCTSSLQCPGDQVCVAGTCGWVLVETMPQCVPDVSGQGTRQAGAACADNDECASNFCDSVLGVCVSPCCNDSTCPTGLSCELMRVEAQDDTLTSARVCMNVSSEETLLRK